MANSALLVTARTRGGIVAERLVNVEDEFSVLVVGSVAVVFGGLGCGFVFLERRARLARSESDRGKVFSDEESGSCDGRGRRRGSVGVDRRVCHLSRSARNLRQSN